MNNKTLKLLVLVLTLCAALVLFGSVALAEDACPEGGEHEWDVMEADCTNGKDRLCVKCGAYEVLSAPLGHDWDTIEPTCTEDGDRLCQRCGVDEVIPALGHDWDTLEPTCGEDGDRLCNRCGEYEVLPATGDHTFTTYVSDNNATCTADGTKTAVCDVCGIGKDTQPEVGTAKGHTWERNGFDITNKKNQNKKNGWTVVTKPTTSKTGVGHYNCLECGAASDSVAISKLKKTSPSSSSESVQPTASVALAYGSIVTDAARAEAEYASANDAAANNVLIITAEPDEGGAYALRNLHITDALLSQLASEKIDTVRFVVGKGTVEFPVSSFTGDAMASAKASLTSPATQYIVTVDPTAVTADGAPGCSVSVSVACEDGSEYDVTSLVADLTLTQNKVTRLVSVAAVYIS